MSLISGTAWHPSLLAATFYPSPFTIFPPLPVAVAADCPVPETGCSLTQCLPINPQASITTTSRALFGAQGGPCFPPPPGAQLAGGRRRWESFSNRCRSIDLPSKRKFSPCPSSIDLPNDLPNVVGITSGSRRDDMRVLFFFFFFISQANSSRDGKSMGYGLSIASSKCTSWPPAAC